MPIQHEDDGPVPVSAARRLRRLAEECVRSVPACCGAAATLGDDAREPEHGPPRGPRQERRHGPEAHRPEAYGPEAYGPEAYGPEADGCRTAATHPDLAALVTVQLDAGEGPVRAALDAGRPVEVPDLLHDTRWPAHRAAALRAGLRTSVTLPFRRPGTDVTLTLYGFRPGSLAGAAHGPAAALGEAATAALVRDDLHRAALAEVAQLETALRSRPVIDQAVGIVVHALGCGTEDAHTVLRRVSQLTNRKLADVAAAVVRARGHGLEKELARLAARPPTARPRTANPRESSYKGSAHRNRSEA
ncbi:MULTISPECIES: GAF and ANTAR domain-containing protein [Streptomyces]|uniref:GAF and ANTAR domain-containing protein n=1 Tax=Streptomyces changanensis TaxID=2964669 RepID=A0ABY5NCK1_9ACTN|nr:MULTISPECIES: GAF and ANTAR domain-containing protein [Streptomyces]UUS33753.1 GAF and ANTAR domain-containing protein [Streptomyces changanensis]